MATNNLNPRCVSCRLPMQSSGPTKWRDRRCRYYVNKYICRLTKRPGRPRRGSPNAPWCVRDRRPMSSKGVNRWMCPTCRKGCRRAVSALKPAIARQQAKILDLVALGLPVRTISRLTGSDYRTIKQVLPPGYAPRLCPCGRPINHTGGCSKRWESRVQNIINQSRASRSTDPMVADISNRVRNSVPVSLPPEVREEVIQQMMVEIAEQVDAVVKRAGQFVRACWRSGAVVRGGLLVSLEQRDAYGRPLGEKLVG